jgi:cell shape-determining protein MreC
MMMGPLYRAPERRFRRHLLLSVLVLMLFGTVGLWYTEVFRTLVFRIAEPVVLMRISILGDTADTRSRVSAYEALIEENARLLEENAHLRVTQMQTDVLKREIATLNEQLLVAASGVQTLRTSIIRRPPETLYDTLLLGAGSLGGVAVGDRVSAGGSFLGRVAHVGNAISTVVLASAPGEETRGFLIQGTSTHPIRLIGLGQGAFESFVPRATEVNQGDTVFVFTDEWEVLGEVASVSDSPTDALLRITLTTPINLWHLRSVDIRSFPRD